MNRLLKAVRAWFYADAPETSDPLALLAVRREMAVENWQAQKARFMAAKKRGDTRLQGEVIRELTRSNCEVLRAERAFEDASRKAVGQ